MRPKPALTAAATLFVGASFFAVISGQRANLDYPQWRGRDRDGAASGFVEPASWPDALTRRWRIDVGEGYATPIVIGDAVYVFTRRNGQEVLSAVSARTGALAWRTGYPAPYNPAPAAAVHGAGPKATPLFYQGRIFTLGVSGILTAFDAATGKIIWKTPVPSEPPYFSAASSPLGIDGLVIVHPGNYEPLTAFDAKTGVVKWVAGDEGLFASPMVAELDGVRQAITATQKSILGVAISSGEVLWRYPFENNGAITPVIHGQNVIISGLNLGAVAIAPRRRNGGWAVDKVWESSEVSMYLSNPVVIGETLFGFSHRSSGQYFAVDAGSGKVLWLGSPRAATNAAVVKAGALLFLLNDDAELIVARGSRTGFEPLKKYQVADSPAWAQPAISGDRIFIKDVSSLALWTLSR